MSRKTPTASDAPWRPTREQLRAAAGQETVPDIIAPDLKLLFCGINPGLYSGAVGHHFARPGNRFWAALLAGGLTPRRLTASEERELLPLGYGITNIVARASARAEELSADELRAGAKKLRAKLLRYRPRFCAVLGISAYRTAFEQPKATLGEQPLTVGKTQLWVLPSPSGLNAHHQPVHLAKLFAQLREAVDAKA